MKQEGDWILECGIAIKACDREGTLLFMNNLAAQNAAAKGGRDLVGSNIYPLHQKASQEKLTSLMEHGATNCYTIEKNGQKSLVYQMPWLENGEVQGMVELTLPLPEDMPHYVRS